MGEAKNNSSGKFIEADLTVVVEERITIKMMAENSSRHIHIN